MVFPHFRFDFSNNIGLMLMLATPIFGAIMVTKQWIGMYHNYIPLWDELGTQCRATSLRFRNLACSLCSYEWHILSITESLSPRPDPC